MTPTNIYDRIKSQLVWGIGVTSTLSVLQTIRRKDVYSAEWIRYMTSNYGSPAITFCKLQPRLNVKGWGLMDSRSGRQAAPRCYNRQGGTPLLTQLEKTRGHRESSKKNLRVEIAVL